MSTSKLNVTKNSKKVEIDESVVNTVGTADSAESKEETKEQDNSFPSVSVDANVVTPDRSNIPEENVKIRLREDYDCCIAMERYSFKKGKVYTVPKNVKKILNKAGLLSPLN